MNPGIYFEFSYLRDLWYAKGNANDTKKALIIELLRNNSFTSTLADRLQKLPTHDFNSKFIQGRISDQFIQSPANWQSSFHTVSHSKGAARPWPVTRLNTSVA
jgi:hypothetical protein